MKQTTLYLVTLLFCFKSHAGLLKSDKPQELTIPIGKTVTFLQDIELNRVLETPSGTSYVNSNTIFIEGELFHNEIDLDEIKQDYCTIDVRSSDKSLEVIPENSTATVQSSFGHYGRQSWLQRYSFVGLLITGDNFHATVICNKYKSKEPILYVPFLNLLQGLVLFN